MGMMVYTLPCPQGFSLDDTDERPLCKRSKVEEIHCFSSHVSREEVHICFQASPCKSASSARQTAEPKGIQAFLKFQMVKIPLRLVAIIPNLDCPSLYIRNYVCFQSPTLNPSYLRYVVSVFLTQPQLLKSVKKFLQYWE